MHDIRLFHMAVPGRLHARTFRCLWLLEELAVKPFDLCMVTPGEPYVPVMREHGMRHLTKLPALLFDGQEVGESGVICQLLAECFQDKRNLLGAEDERLERLQWSAFAETCVMLRLPYKQKIMDSNTTLETIRAEVIAPQQEVLKGNIERFEAHFRDQNTDYLLKSGFSIADTMCGWSLYTFSNWGLFDINGEDSPLTLSYLERLRARPAFRRTEAYAELSPGLYTIE
ncbi:MAG: glutathione S-transferase family protein [Pseudomonadota bacterium]